MVKIRFRLFQVKKKVPLVGPLNKWLFAASLIILQYIIISISFYVGEGGRINPSFGKLQEHLLVIFPRILWSVKCFFLAYFEQKNMSYIILAILNKSFKKSANEMFTKALSPYTDAVHSGQGCIKYANIRRTTSFLPNTVTQGPWERLKQCYHDINPPPIIQLGFKPTFLTCKGPSRQVERMKWYR